MIQRRKLGAGPRQGLAMRREPESRLDSGRPWRGSRAGMAAQSLTVPASCRGPGFCSQTLHEAYNLLYQEKPASSSGLNGNLLVCVVCTYTLAEGPMEP